MEILEEWIAGRGKRPVTWSTLIEVLHDIELSTLAREIAAVKLLEGDEVNRPTEVTEYSSQKTTNNIGTGVTEDHRGITNGSIQDFRHENSEEEVDIDITDAMLLECGDPDEDSEGSVGEDSDQSDARPTKDTEYSTVTLNSLIEALHNIELSTLAREIEAVKLPTGVEDSSTDTTEGTEDSNLRIVSGVSEDSGIPDRS